VKGVAPLPFFQVVPNGANYGILHGGIPFFFLVSSALSNSTLQAALTSASLIDAGNVTTPTYGIETTLDYRYDM